MTPKIRYPNITGKTPEEQIAQLKSYIHQLVDQLNWAFAVIDSQQNSNPSSAKAAEK